MDSDFIILASASPRRSELLRQIDVAHRVAPAAIAEVRAAGETGAEYVRRLAAEKARAAATRRAGEPPVPILAADTIVCIGASVLGKPADAGEAEAMLARLSGGWHEVMTAVTLLDGGWEGHALSRSKVRFAATTAVERAQYCASGEPFDKAGGYGIQGLGAVFIEELVGSYSGVMGLPLFETAALLRSRGLLRWMRSDA